ncbi:HEAT repeat domain-containing protein [Streptomyces sp. NPDC059851]|uniref:HEAT repeat domain-containing protein n=1 Tax=Streptomyces sp. NPDC059851 TaxID=3346971 RepID=UPI003649FFF2
MLRPQVRRAVGECSLLRSGGARIRCRVGLGDLDRHSPAHSSPSPVNVGEHADPRADAALLPYASHPDARVRGAVARGFGTWSELPAFSDVVREALLVLMTDTDTAVRRDACLTVGQGKDRDPVLAEAMAALLDDTDRQVQVAAVHGLALHDDARCVEAARRLGPPQPGFLTEEHYLGTERA